MYQLESLYVYDRNSEMQTMAIALPETLTTLIQAQRDRMVNFDSRPKGVTTSLREPDEHSSAISPLAPKVFLSSPWSNESSDVLLFHFHHKC